MTLTAADVAEIMRLVEESSFNELTLEVEGFKLSLKRGNGASTEPQTSSGAQSASSLHAAPSTPAGQSTPHASALTTRDGHAAPPGTSSAPSSTQQLSVAPAKPVTADPNSHAVAAPLLGTFYRAPKPGAPPFVEVGSQVEDETVVGIIEVMKLMNTVRAGVRGTVTEILARDGALVEYGETIMRVRTGH